MFNDSFKELCVLRALDIANKKGFGHQASSNCICEQVLFSYGLLGHLGTNMKLPSAKSIQNWVHQYLKNDGVFDHDINARKRSSDSGVSAVDLEYAIDLLKAEPTLYYQEISVALWWKHHVAYSGDMIRRALHNAGYTDKYLETHAKERSQSLIDIWNEVVVNSINLIPASSYAFIDEMQSNISDCERKRGKSQKGSRAVAYRIFHQVGENSMFAIVTMSIEGALNVTTVAINDCETFLYAFEHNILPVISDRCSHVVIDNAYIHLKPELIMLSDLHNIMVLFLPPYCPFFESCRAIT